MVSLVTWKFVFPEKDDRGLVSHTHIVGRLAAQFQGDGMTQFASFMVMPVDLMKVTVK
jgi:hypothetical protein